MHPFGCSHVIWQSGSGHFSGFLQVHSQWGSSQREWHGGAEHFILHLAFLQTVVHSLRPLLVGESGHVCIEQSDILLGLPLGSFNPYLGQITAQSGSSHSSEQKSTLSSGQRTWQSGALQTGSHVS